jgi:hypothetical protein
MLTNNNAYGITITPCQRSINVSQATKTKEKSEIEE